MTLQHSRRNLALGDQPVPDIGREHGCVFIGFCAEIEVARFGIVSARLWQEMLQPVEAGLSGGFEDHAEAGCLRLRMRPITRTSAAPSADSAPISIEPQGSGRVRCGN